MEKHKKWVQEIFDRASPTYGDEENRFFGMLGERLVSRSGVSPGASILDVATGKGAVLLPASRIVGSRGKAFGVDLSLGMIQELGKKVASPWIQLKQMDAEHLLFPDETFDVLFCAFAIFFFSNVEKALSEFKRVLKPGGKLAISIWGKRSPLNLWVMEKAKGLGAVQSLRAQDIETKAALQKILEADFPSVRVNEENIDYFYKSKESWWNSLWSHGSRGMLEQLSAEKLDLLKQEAFCHIVKEPIEMPIQAFFAFAEKK